MVEAVIRLDSVFVSGRVFFHRISRKQKRGLCVLLSVIMKRILCLGRLGLLWVDFDLPMSPETILSSESVRLALRVGLRARAPCVWPVGARLTGRGDSPHCGHDGQLLLGVETTRRPVPRKERGTSHDLFAIMPMTGEENVTEQSELVASARLHSQFSSRWGCNEGWCLLLWFVKKRTRRHPKW